MFSNKQNRNNYKTSKLETLQTSNDFYLLLCTYYLFIMHTIYYHIPRPFLVSKVLFLNPLAARAKSSEEQPPSTLEN